MRRVLLICLSLLATFAPIPGLAESPDEGESLPPTEVESRLVGMPREELFHPLLGDPKELRTFATYLHSSSRGRSTDVGAVGLSERWGIVRHQGQREGNGWQFGLSGGVFAQFDMGTSSMDLVNADYLIGFPLTWRRGGWSGRFNLYHQSSHLGDEFLLHTNAERINLSFEAVEVLVARDLGPLRVYGGGEYLIDPEPSDLAPGVLHAGVEYRHSRRTVSIGKIGKARWVAAADLKSLEEHDWTVAWSFRAGLEFSPVEARPGTRRSWSLLVEAYEGPSPWGQFYQNDVSYLGSGFHLSL
ncbi:MAG: DUF1207 domain-containing protein [Thermoanaerobaculia bacterium]|nr:DUF1207 domain-containing protein [Thermoanaerobaculia bacterium]